MFNVAPINVAAPLVPVVVNVIASCLPLKVSYSVLLINPAVTDATLANGMFIVCVGETEFQLGAVPVVPGVAKFCTWLVSPFNAVNPVVNVVSTSQRFPFSVCNVIVLPLVIT